ncbi:transposase [Catovirus CTV1]|uniref:Transposase n=1 Tax=Catovirus CTV1 TaxID=1977631 RepID=A0A1V0SAM8_9VIRU|nr:transposase [Catovirus CTV1]
MTNKKKKFKFKKKKIFYKKYHNNNNNSLSRLLKDNQYYDLSSYIFFHGDLFWKHNYNLPFKSQLSYSWFDFHKSIQINPANPIMPSNARFVDKTKFNAKKTESFVLHPNSEQKKILLAWIDAFTDMMNETIKFQKNRLFHKKQLILDSRKLRDHDLKTIKNKIISRTGVNSHVMDQAIKLICEMYDSSIANIRNHKRPFRIRYIKRNKNKRILKMEKVLISKNGKTFCSSVFGKFLDNRLSNVTSDFTIQYDKSKDRFMLFYTKNANKIKTNKKGQIGLDPGIRTFLTGYSNNHAIKIADNAYDRISDIHNKIDEIRGSNLSKRRKIKALEKRESKIENLVKDLHWKTAKYLTDNYGEIIMGNFSTKKMGEQESMNKMVKRVGNSLSLYKFKQKLQYKCLLKNVKYKEVDESHTSKLCSNCGVEYKWNLQGKKIYECNYCGLHMDRDINGAKNIMIKSIIRK